MHKKNELREAITLESSGLKVFGILHRPVECEKGVKVPAVVMLHGFGGNKSGRHRLITRLAERLSENGIASLRIDCRGSGDSEGDFGDTTIETLTEDALLALNFLMHHPSIDAHRIGIYGRSLGGLIAVNTASRFVDLYPESLRAIVLWAPVYDAKPWLSRAAGTEQITRTITTAGDGKTFYFLGEELHPQFIAQFRNFNAEQCLHALDQIPLFIIQGENDQTVDNYHQKQYENERKQCPMTQMLLLSKTDHEFSDRAEQIVALEETTAYFIKQLGVERCTALKSQEEVGKTK